MINKIYSGRFCFASTIAKFIAILTLLTLAACERDDAVLQEESLQISDPDNFAQYFNKLPGLAAGEYKVVATTNSAGGSGSYALSIAKDDGSVIDNSGSWSAAAGASLVFNITDYDPAHVYSFSLNKAGGINISLTSESADSYLYLLDRNNNVLFDSSSTYPGITLAGTGINNVEVVLAESISNQSAYAEAYYDSIDSDNERDTLYKWRLANCFTNDATNDFGADIHLIFRDTKDLGYGRNMYWKFGCDGKAGEDMQPGAAAVFVENFNVVLIPGFPYSTVNLEAAIANDRQYHFGTNAIEFNDWRSGSTSTEKFNKFYTFRPLSDSNDADEIRLNTVNLDDRGEKAMPLPCIYCHGGNALPLQANGKYYIDAISGIQGDTDAKFQALDIDELEFVKQGVFTREQQEANLKIVNQAMYCTYPGASESTFCSQTNRFNTSFNAMITSGAGNWTGDFFREVIQGWYGDDTNSKELLSDTYDGNYIPSGWDPNNIANAGNPAGIGRLYLDVIKPTCMVCHARQGNELGTDFNSSGDGKDIDFSSYDKFISYADRIEELVYDRGRMPLSLLGYEKFWEADQPTILASFLPDFSHYDEAGNVIQPGRPFADAGPDRQVNVPAHISGDGSEFSESYLWEVIDQPVSSNPVLSKENTARVKFDTDTDGLYILKLTVTQGDMTHTDTVQILKLNALPLPASLTFESDVEPLIGSVGSLGCDSCHSDTSISAGVQGLQPGVPEVWDGSGNKSAYDAVMSRVYLNDPADSLLLRKPAGDHHYGGTVIDRDTVSGALAYNTILSWIIEGTVEK